MGVAGRKKLNVGPFENCYNNLWISFIFIHPGEIKRLHWVHPNQHPGYVCMCVWVLGWYDVVKANLISALFAEDRCCVNTDPRESARGGQDAGGVVDEIWFELSHWNGKYHIRGTQCTVCLHAMFIVVLSRPPHMCQYHTDWLLCFWAQHAKRITSTPFVWLARFLGGQL